MHKRYMAGKMCDLTSTSEVPGYGWRLPGGKAVLGDGKGRGYATQEAAEEAAQADAVVRAQVAAEVRRDFLAALCAWESGEVHRLDHLQYLVRRIATHLKSNPVRRRSKVVGQ